ncbi:rhodanese-related sulfurtransferase [Candidatus Woesearchaeota archaeon]|nr:rhodanese-related sulfurtransferase [Candidatus Woesearchaeota archaeon]
MKNILFYKYTNILVPEQLHEEIRGLCHKLGILGTVLLAHEGINGCVSGDDKAIAQLKNFLDGHRALGKIDYKITNIEEHTFHKLIVRVKKEIVSSGMDQASLAEPARYIEPQELKQLLEQGKDVVLLDARNDYESKIGKFAGAITPQIATFRSFPTVVEELAPYKEKEIITYCTGGIRCEKASAFLQKKGFNVRQLHGGIIRYGETCGNEFWEGKCFVFDNRGAVDINPQQQNKPITQCEHCFLPWGTYHHCANQRCDKRTIACNECKERLEGCCSKGCRNEMLKKRSVLMHDDSSGSSLQAV